MVHPNEILEGLKTACSSSDRLPDSVTYATVELDAESEHANVSLPIIEYKIEDIDRNLSRNTERVGVELDEAGNEIGEIYQSWFDMRVTASVITASRGEQNHRSLDQDLRDVLVLYDDHTLGLSLPDPHGPSETLTGVSQFQVGKITPNHDFSTSPTMRARELTLYISFVHDYFTTDVHKEYEFVDDVEIQSVSVS